MAVSISKGYVKVEPYDYGYERIECQGTEQALEECEIGEVTSQMCDQVAVVQCSYGIQVYIADFASWLMCEFCYIIAEHLHFLHVHSGQMLTRL